MNAGPPQSAVPGAIVNSMVPTGSAGGAQPGTSVLVVVLTVVDVVLVSVVLDVVVVLVAVDDVAPGSVVEVIVVGVVVLVVPRSDGHATGAGALRDWKRPG